MTAAMTTLIFLLNTTPAAPLNPGHSGAWFNPETPGQGLVIEYIEADRQLFAAWFTYGEETPSKVGAPEHRWLTAQGPVAADSSRVELMIYNTSGGVFDAQASTNTELVGSAVIELFDCHTGSLSYDLPDDGLRGGFDLVRISDGGECERVSKTIPRKR